MTAKKSSLLRNPAFAKANDITLWSRNNEKDSTLNKLQLQKALRAARKSGKLSLPDIGLTHPLPDDLFDLRKDVIEKAVSSSSPMDDSRELEGDASEIFWECYGEEMLIFVDLSHNNLSYSSNHGVKIPNHSMLDQRIGKYVAIRTLRINNCQLDSLPFDIMKEKLTALATLDAGNNLLTELPLDLLPLSISHVLVPNNKISSLFSSKSITTNATGNKNITLPNLIELNIQQNSLQSSSFPHHLSTPHLQQLLISNNKIDGLSISFLESSKDTLSTLDASDNLFSPEYQFDFSSHTNLKVIDFNNNRLTVIPSVNPNLVRLAMNNNNITTIEGLFPTLDEDNVKSFRSEMKELHLGSNKLTMNLHVPTTSVMTKLAILDVSHNALEALPSVVGYLPQLHKISLEGNPLRMIRSSIKFNSDGLIDTTSLKISLRKKGPPPEGSDYLAEGTSYCGDKDDNLHPVSSSKKEADARILLSQAISSSGGVLNMSKITHTYSTFRSRNGVTLNEPEIFKLLSDMIRQVDGADNKNSRCFQKWIITDCKLTSIADEWFESLFCLSHLDASNNLLQSLPTNIHSLPLETLLIVKNCLTSAALRESIFNSNRMITSRLVQTLHTLNLANNNIEYIPSSLFALKSLVTMNISYNNIQSLSYEIETETHEAKGWKHGLTSLQSLDISNNKLLDLGYMPLTLIACPNLRTLNLSNNCLEEIPLELGLLVQLNRLDLLGNPQRMIRLQILQKNCVDVLEYLKRRMTEDQLEAAREHHRNILYTLKKEEEGEGNGVMGNHADISVRNNDDSNLGRRYDNEMQNERAEECHDYTRQYSERHTLSKSAQEVELTTTIQSINQPMSTRRTTTTTSTSHQKVEKQPKITETTPNTEQIRPTDESATTIVLDELKIKIDEMMDKLEYHGLTSVKRYALKKELAMLRSKYIREERRLKELNLL